MKGIITWKMKSLATADYVRFAERPTTNLPHYQERITKPLFAAIVRLRKLYQALVLTKKNRIKFLIRSTATVIKWKINRIWKRLGRCRLAAFFSLRAFFKYDHINKNKHFVCVVYMLIKAVLYCNIHSQPQRLKQKKRRTKQWKTTRYSTITLNSSSSSYSIILNELSMIFAVINSASVIPLTSPSNPCRLPWN